MAELGIHAGMSNNMWAREDRASDDELDELRSELADTMDDHEKVERKNQTWRQRLFPSRARPRTNSVVQQRMAHLRTGTPANVKTAQSVEPPQELTSRGTECHSCNTSHRYQFAPSRFDTVEHSLRAIHDLACYLEKSPRTIWLALEGVFTARQTTSAPTLFRHRVTILARVLPTAVVFLLVAFGLLHFLLPNRQTDIGYTPVFSEVGFLLFVALFTTVTFFVLAAVMLLLKSKLQERFLNGFSRLVNWSIPIILSFYMASPEFLLLFQDLAGGTSSNVDGIEAVLQDHSDIVEIIYWTVLAYVAVYTGIFFSFVAFSKVFEEQREYAHRHEVLRDVIPILVSDHSDTQPTKLFRMHRPYE